jgi:magnesium-transporting ATPase (P-type)
MLTICRSIAIIADGMSTSSCILHHEDLFIQLFRKCKTAIFCRMDPLQKSEIIVLLKKMGLIALAVGDGANDVSMILQSSVGIGIVGKEGRQAAAACDYQIRKFGQLPRLLLVHGRWSYIRLSSLLYASFYCNLAFVGPLMFYCIFNGFSGTSLYPSELVSLLSGFAGPLYMMMGVTDIDIKAETCLKYPEAYRRMNGSKSLFNPQVFFLWTFAAFYQGAVVFFVPYILFENNVFYIDGTTMDLSGMSTWLFCLSIVIHTAVLLVHTKYISIFTLYVNLYILVLLMLFIAFMSYTGVTTSIIGSVLQISGTYPFYYLATLLCLVLVLVPHLAYKYMIRQLFTADWHVLQEKEVLKLAHRRDSPVRAGSNTAPAMKVMEMVKVTEANSTEGAEASPSVAGISILQDLAVQERRYFIYSCSLHDLIHLYTCTLSRVQTLWY